MSPCAGKKEDRDGVDRTDRLHEEADVRRCNFVRVKNIACQQNGVYVLAPGEIQDPVKCLLDLSPWLATEDSELVKDLTYMNIRGMKNPDHESLPPPTRLSSALRNDG